MLSDALSGAQQLPGSSGAREILVAEAGRWYAIAQAAAAQGGELLTLWADAGAGGESSNPAMAGGAARGAGPCVVHAAILLAPGVLVLTLAPVWPDTPYPSLQQIFPAAARMQRAAFDLTGVCSDADDQRPWLRHAAWPVDWRPLASEPEPAASTALDDYAFVRVAGDGVHEVPVGPVHAGIIEPGHFRFSVVGEKVLRLEARLGYVHKGLERRMAGLLPAHALALAARASGDSTVAFSWAFCLAAEALLDVEPPARAVHLRALALEVERLQNHLGDLGALGNDAGFAFGLAQFSRLKELLLRACMQALGSRYLFDFIGLGGTARDLGPAGAEAIADCVAALPAALERLRSIYDEHAGVRDRFVGAGIVSAELVHHLGLAGMAARASGHALDLRSDAPWAPYDTLAVRKCTQSSGDVAARVALRFEEALESCRLIALLLATLPDGPCLAPLPPAAPAGTGAWATGLVEGWRGPVFVALQLHGDGTIQRCHLHDPSSRNWPALEHAIIGNIVPDFPLINKSFNLSYSGHDL
jgi:Ni,Fe-hydrogenase III large subunit